MAFTINRIVLVGGNLTADAIRKYASTGDARVTFCVAMNRKTKTQTGEWQDVAEFFNVVFWGKLAESIHPYLKKGQKVALEGRLSQRRYTTQDGQNHSVIEIAATSVVLMGNKKPEHAEQNNTSQYAAPSSKAQSVPPATNHSRPLRAEQEELDLAERHEGGMSYAPLDESDCPF